MNKNITSEAEERLAQLLESIAALKQAKGDMTDVTTAQERERAKLKKIGRPSFRDTAGIEELAKIQIRLGVSDQCAVELKAGLDAAFASAREVLHACGSYCGELFGDALDQRFGEIAESFAAHFESRARAVQVARETDSARRALGFVSNLKNTALNVMNCTDTERMEVYASTISEVLTEAAKAQPDLCRFLRPANGEARAGK